MKKRLLSFLLAVCTAVSLLVLPAGAAGTTRFSDVPDQNTAITVEILRLMGVMDGYKDGTFRPNTPLNRAQFCKMATYAMNAQQRLGLYRTVTVFPDVKPSHWAAAYINLASRTSVGGGGEENAPGQTVIAGYPDGKFHPERTVTMGQAVTILLRILGYRDSEIGGVWPDSFMATGSVAGLLAGLPTDGNAPLTRVQAAKLFVNMLKAKTPANGTLYTLSEETELASVDGGSGTIKTMDGKSYSMVNPVKETSFTGMKGRLVMSGEQVLTFLPEFGKGTATSAGAIVLYEDQSAAGLEALAGNSGYQIYKNGSPATVADLRKYDVATYYPDTNSIIVCDTRVSVFYESCEPKPEAPTKIQVLNGTEFYVLPTAVDSVKEFRPGEKMTLLLTADGRVAGAVKPGTSGARSNAIGIVTADGKVELFCGSDSVALNVKPAENMLGKVVRISAERKDDVNLSEAAGGKQQALNVAEKKMGKNPLASGVMIYEEGVRISLSQLTRSEIPASQIRYARTNWAGEVDLIVLDRVTDEIYGRVFWESERDESAEGEQDKWIEKVGVETGNGEKTDTFRMKYNVVTGDMVVAKINKGGTGFSMMIKLPKLDDISWNSWIGMDTVNAGGRNYEVPTGVKCYNRDSREWITLEQAKAYAETADLYVRDGMVRIVEVGSAKK